MQAMLELGRGAEKYAKEQQVNCESFTFFFFVRTLSLFYVKWANVALLHLPPPSVMTVHFAVSSALLTD